MSEGQLFFIYGTLRKGGRAQRLMEGAEFVAMGTVEGRIVHVDQYPGLIKSEGERVIGEVYRVCDEMIPELDRYEGCFESPQHYEREEIEVAMEDGGVLVAQVYQFLLVEGHHEKIESGDWFDWLKTSG